jgi:hypothetical protein
LAFLIFCGGLYYLRTSKKDNVVQTDIVDVANTPVSFPKQTTVLRQLSDNAEIGFADRGLENGILYHTVKVSLPAIDRQKEFYEGWLARQSPYDFFSTGEMVTNELGEFILEWVGEHDEAISFDKIIITKELYDNNPEPSERVAEGVFNSP